MSRLDNGHNKDYNQLSSIRKVGDFTMSETVLAGKPGKIPKPDLITTVDADLLQRARRVARDRGISVSAIVERALDRYLPTLEGQEIQSNTPTR